MLKQQNLAKLPGTTPGNSPLNSYAETMNIIILKKNSLAIELLVNNEFDLSLLTMHADELFDCKDVLEKAMADFMNDYSIQQTRYRPMIEQLKAAGVIGYPVTPMRDARLYAADRKIAIESELEICCD